MSAFFLCYCYKKCMLITQEVCLLPHALQVASFKESEIRSALLMLDFLDSDRNVCSLNDKMVSSWYATGRNHCVMDAQSETLHILELNSTSLREK